MGWYWLWRWFLVSLWGIFSAASIWPPFHGGSEGMSVSFLGWIFPIHNLLAWSDFQNEIDTKLQAKMDNLKVQPYFPILSYLVKHFYIYFWFFQLFFNVLSSSLIWMSPIMNIVFISSYAPACRKQQHLIKIQYSLQLNQWATKDTMFDI